MRIAPVGLITRKDAREGPVSTILFVDDHHAVRTVFAETLRSDGHMVLEAGTLADAEYLVERQPGAIDLLIVEAVLTTTNGLEIAKRFQSAHPDVRVLFISEESAKSLSAKGLLPKGAHFLQKPFAAEDLIGRLQQLLNAGKGRETGDRARSVESGRARGKSIHPRTARSHR